ncbi:MFS transporter [Convivina intestini]|uniref:EmrB/QacA subfamily drug resistance transporter n=1 Tax=Convivina intestini TaxID=1505726 RepID=A0A2U1DBN6_9LACO|nr:MFS transporter [Convivina intestini]PVY85090.1 EmrB/QacA subfamily drug resistance transporter [Convivina intestini]CAH1853686.1 putative transport protein HsrA [Convivina intestini]SDB88704.1 drug resistance transporter, EmrB/QacA subfamily [Leuconostocaceae bacterium R-53105]
MAAEKQLTPRLILSILSIALLGFTDIMLETALNVSFPTIMTELSVNSATVQWLTSGVILLTSLVIILSPWLKKNFTNRSQFMVAGIISVIGIAIDAVSDSFWLILFGRLLQGIGGGVGLPLMNNVVFEQVPERKRGTMIGLASLIVSFAPALGPAFGGFLTEHYGWHMVFWVVLPVQIISLGLGWFTIKQLDPLVKEKLDLIGWILLSTFFVSGILAIEHISSHGFTDPVSLVTLTIMLLGLVGYCLYARKQTHPLLDLAIFKSNIFAYAVAAAFTIQTINLTFNYAIPMGLQLVLHQSSQVAGFALFPGAIGFAFMSILSGNLYDRYGAKLPNALGLSLFGAGMLWMVLMPFTVLNMTLGFGLVQLGAGCWFGNNMTNAVSHVARKFHSAGNSIFAASNNYSAAIGIALAAGIISAFQSQSTNIAQATETAISWTYRLDLLLMVFAFAFSIIAIRNSYRTKTD